MHYRTVARGLRAGPLSLTCKLVGSFLLSQLQEKFGDKIGLYRDDGLAVTDTNARQTENIKKDICRVFINNRLKITIEANKQTVNFLDVTLNPIQNTYHLYMKPNSTLQYVHRDSNHPPAGITKNIPAGINKRLSTLSSDKSTFDVAASPYQKALDESGNHHKLEYNPMPNNKRRNRKKQNILWFNPPFSKNVTRNIGNKFLNLLDHCFPKNYKLRKIFNRNTVKIIYSCMNNTKQIIDNHNKKILKNHNNNNYTPDTKTDKTCNCLQKDTYPLAGNCLQSSVIYQAIL